jgi:hypothetical protein
MEVDYPAIPVVYPSLRHIPSFLHYIATQYHTSEITGIKHLAQDVTNFIGACPGSYVVMAGYSQGAQVVGDTYLSHLTVAQQARVSGIAMLGDPDFNGSSPVDIGSYDHTENGVWAYAHSKRHVPATLRHNVASYCTQGDPICNFGVSNLLACHDQPKLCPHAHYIDLYWGNHRYVIDAGDFLVKRYNAADKWAIQSTPRPPGPYSGLNSVSCASASACTAVGFSNSGTSTLAERWNGTAWTIQTPPNPSAGGDLEGVSCSSASACTAVGSTGFTSTLAEQWNGTAWTIQTTPNPPGMQAGGLDGVSCTSASACTAVGWYQTSSGPEFTLAEQWNGTAWTIQTTPKPSGSTDTELNSVSCTSASACTAVGFYQNPLESLEGTLAERWNGTSWTIQSTPNPSGSSLSDLFGVSCTSASNCTAVGSSATSTLAERWDGTSWTIQSTPNPPGSTQIFLDGVSCTSASSCTAVGHYQSTLTLAEVWNGTSWAIQGTPNKAGYSDSALAGVSCTSVSACTAVGAYSKDEYNNTSFTLAEKE